MQNPPPKLSASPFGLIGVAIGVVALSLALFQGQVRRAVSPPPPPSANTVVTTKELAVKLGRALLEAKTKPAGAKEAKPTGMFEGPTDAVTLGYMGLGVLALLFGVVGFLRRENRRVVGAAVALGIVSAAWTYVVVALLIAVAIMVFAAVFT